MKLIRYLVSHSKFYSPIDEVVSEQIEAIRSGQYLEIAFEGKAYKQKPIKASITQSQFLADFKNPDVTRFCARLKALATVLRDRELYGNYIISHVEGVCGLQKVDVSVEHLLAIITNDTSLSRTVRESLVKARIGQGKYRDELLVLEKKCRVTETTDKRFLRASHLKPWSQSSNQERLDPNNGLLFAPHIDALFDKGWITFSSQGTLIISDESIATQLKVWGLSENINLGALRPEQEAYMQYHREFVFRGHAL